MKPTEAYEAIAGIISQAVKRPYRDEPVTEAEWSVIADKVLLLAREQELLLRLSRRNHGENKETEANHGAARNSSKA